MTQYLGDQTELNQTEDAKTICRIFFNYLTPTLVYIIDLLIFLNKRSSDILYIYLYNSKQDVRLSYSGVRGSYRFCPYSKTLHNVCRALKESIQF